MKEMVVRDIERIFEEYVRNSTARGMASARTWDAYKRGMASFIAYLIEYDRHIKSVNTGDIELYRRFLIEQGKKPRTIMVRLAAIRVLFRALIKVGFIKKDPSRGVRPPKIDTPADETIARKIVLPQPFAQVLSGFTDSLRDKRDRVILLFMYMLGMRVSEVAGLKIESFKDGKIEFLAKGNKIRALPAPDILQNAINNYLSSIGDKEGSMFGLTVRAIQKMVKSRFSKIGYNISPHALRHSCATVSAINNASPFAIQDQLGHESQKTTGLYTKIAGRFMKSPAIILNEVLKCV